MQAFSKQLINKLPLRPYCSDNLDYGIAVRARQDALLKRYIQFNHPYYTNFLIFDLDYPAAYVEYFYSMVGIPTPNLILENPENGHAHFIYQLETPIYNTDASNQKPIRYGNAVYNALSEVLGADRSYSGLIAKNAVHEHWRAHILRNEPYTLKQLSEHLELSGKDLKPNIKLEEAFGLGRNCYLFDTVRLWAYVEVRSYRTKGFQEWFNSVYKQCCSVNGVFKQPMQLNEVKSIAKSISKWVWKKDPYCYQEFIERQKLKGRKGGKKSNSSNGGYARSFQYSDARHTALKLHKQGINNTQIAEQLKVSRKTITRWLNNRKI